MFQPKVFSPAVEKALAEVCPSDDPIDRPDFDPIAYINQRFPDEASLAKLPKFHEDTTKRLQQTEAELFRAVEVQTLSATSAAKDLRDASSAVNTLNARVSEIKAKATDSENTVRELCQNIRQLDTAKTNLTTSINTLRSIQLWMLQLQTLNVTFEKRNWVQCRDALREALKYSAMFEKYKDIAKVRELMEKQTLLKSRIEHNIRNQVIGDMQTIDEGVMAEVCAVIDILGPESIAKVRTTYIEKELDVYSTKFKRGTEDARLDKTERRYVFIRTLLENNQSMFHYVFPRHWCVPQELCCTFCIRTKNEFDYLLKESAGSIDVATLTFALQKTIDVERELTQMMSWKEDFPGRAQLPDYKYTGMILIAFKAHMGLFVQNEDALMEEALRNIADDEALRDDANLRAGATLSVMDDLFVFIKESLKRTIKVNQQHILVDMSRVWAKHLIKFAQTLQQIVPNPTTTPSQIRKACVIINTAETCQTTCTNLAEEVATRAETTAEEVEFDDVSKAFSVLYSTSISAVVAGLEKAIAPALQDFGSGNFMNPNRAEDAQDESGYVVKIRRDCQDTITIAASVLQPEVLRFLVDKIASTIIPKYTLYFYKLRRPSVIMVNQMRLDCTSLERMFLSLPNAGNSERFQTNMLTHFIKLVRREFDRLNRSLKVLQCEVGDTFPDVYYEITLPEDRSIQNFTRLVELKGLRREDVRPYLVALTRKGVPESTKRDAQRENQIQNLPGGSSSIGPSGVVNVAASAASGIVSSVSGVFGGPKGDDASSPSAMDNVASKFTKVVRPISTATTFLSNLKDRVVIAKDKDKDPQAAGRSASPRR